MADNIVENLLMIKWMAMDSLHGPKVRFIKVITKMMKNMDLERWLMEIDHHIKDIGYVVSNMERVYTLIMLAGDMKVTGKMVEW